MNAAMPRDLGHVLVINCGSSSIKYQLLMMGQGELVAGGVVERIGEANPVLKHRCVAAGAPDRAANPREVSAADHREAFHHIVEALRTSDGFADGAHLIAVGHRVVHGGAEFSEPVWLTEELVGRLEALVPLAPLHQPYNLAAIRTVAAWRPDLPQVACFDTAFHRSHSMLADRYALPAKYYEAGIRRYGFHGISYAYIASALPRVAPALAKGRVIVAHLGNGASLCALASGRSVDSTMGFSTLDGLCMGTRAGSLDPGVLVHLLRHRGMALADLERLLYRESGLLGLSGLSGDMRQLLSSQDPAAQLAVDYFVWRIAKEIGALAMTLGGLDGLVFTAGIGENQPIIRTRVSMACEWLGCQLDADANAVHGPRISTTASAVSAWVIPTHEEEMIARDVWRLVRRPRQRGKDA